MTRRWLLLFAAPTLAVGTIAMRGSAQQAPAGNGASPTSMPAEGDGGGPGGGPEMNDNGPRGPFGDRGPRGGGGPFGDHGFGRGGPGGMNGGPGGGGPMMERRIPSMDVMRGYMELVDRYTRLASDADAAGVSAVLAANDLMRAKGPDAGIAYFTKMLDGVPRPAIKRAIRIQLIDLYKAAGKTDLAIEQIEILMKAPIEK